MTAKYVVRKIDNGHEAFFAGDTLFGRCWSGRDEAVEISRERAEGIAASARTPGEYTPRDRVVDVLPAEECADAAREEA
jgi:hypothetical protein